MDSAREWFSRIGIDDMQFEFTATGGGHHETGDRCKKDNEEGRASESG